MTDLDCYCDYDPATVYSATLVKRARKRYACEECCNHVEIGQPYERVFGVWEGYASTFITCEQCVDLRTWVKNNVPCFCWAHGNLHDDAKQTIEEACYRAPLETVGLRFGFLRRAHR